MRGLDAELGSIQPGKWADFTVLDQSPMDVDPMDIRDLIVWGSSPRETRVNIDGVEIPASIWCAEEGPHMKLREFKGNVAHSNHDGFMGDRAPRADGRGWIYFLGAGPPKLARVRADGIDAACEPVSDRVRWLNRNAWVADDAGLLAVLTPLDRVARAGVYRLSEPPELLVELPELALRPTSSIELVGHGDHLIGALPALASSDVWIVRGTTAAQPTLASR